MTEHYRIRERDGYMGETHYVTNTTLAHVLDTCRELAREWPEPEPNEGTYWIEYEVDKFVGTDADTMQDDDPDEWLEGVEHLTIRIDPIEPPCTADEHDWRGVGGLEENPGVFGHGGGVFIVEQCSHCSLRRVTDTWARNPITGEQGYTSITYPDVYQDDYADDCEYEYDYAEATASYDD